MELKTFFDHLADAITSRGTVAVRDQLEELADEVRDSQPGAAAALTDWEGAEIARERAFSVIRREQLHRLAREQVHAFSVIGA